MFWLGPPFAFLVPFERKADSKMTSHSTWTLTQEAFDSFLARLGSDRAEAGAQYQTMRAALVRYFSEYGHLDADECADQTLDRLVRKNSECQIDNLTAYMYAVARWVRVENHRRTKREVPLSETANLTAVAGDPHEAVEKAEKLAIVHRSAQQLSGDDAALLAAYFPSAGDERAGRRALAVALGISAAALRLRLCRARRRLERATVHGRARNSLRAVAMAA
jgi:DNA-directed RNA polymerase specialized sigma24 family protein